LKDGILGAPEFGCADHLHGFGDLLRVLDGFDPVAYLFELSCHSRETSFFAVSGACFGVSAAGMRLLTKWVQK
jgi:hypothetical protein